MATTTPESHARRRRLVRLGGVVLVALVAIVIAIVVSSSGGNKTTKTTAAPQAVTAVDQLLKGIPQSGNTLGQARAPVTVTVYEDLQCPICRDFTLASQAQLIKNEVRAGKAKLVFRSLQTATPDPTTFQVQQQAADAAGRQNKLWHFVELFYHQQGQEGTPYVTEAYLDRLARQVPGLNYQSWINARKAGTQAVTSDEARAKSSGFNSTPTIVVQGPKASPQPVAGALDYGSLAALVKQAGG